MTVTFDLTLSDPVGDFPDNLGLIVQNDANDFVSVGTYRIKRHLRGVPGHHR
jgi:hypothetical protein